MLKSFVFGICFLLIIAGITGSFLLVEKGTEKNWQQIERLIQTENEKVENEAY